MLQSIKNLLRLSYIAFVLARSDALFLLRESKIAPFISRSAAIFTIGTNKSKRPGQKIAEAFIKLGPVFIKLGQALSTRSDLVGEEIAADLSILQDKMPPFPADIAKATIEAELGQEIKDVFSEFEDGPVAAASIAQVHFARDLKGNNLAVKVLRPGIEQKFERDIKLLKFLAKLTEPKLPRRLKPVEVIKKFAETVKIEMDLRLEAAAASEFRDNFKSDNSIYVPKILWQLTSQRVMVTEKIEGIRIDRHTALTTAGHNVNDILTKAASIIFNMVLRDGFFHGDMHPGNIFVTKKGRIALVDFGITGRLDKKSRSYLTQMLHGFFTRDYKKVAEVHFEAGYVPRTQNMELFAQACRSIGEPILGLPQNEISVSKLLAQLFKVSEDFQMELQPQLLLLQKNMMMIEGVGRSLNPNVNIWKLAEPLIIKWAKEQYTLESKLRTYSDDVIEIIKNAKSAINSLAKLSEVVTSDGIKLHPETIKAFKKK